VQKIRQFQSLLLLDAGIDKKVQKLQCRQAKPAALLRTFIQRRSTQIKGHIPNFVLLSTKYNKKSLQYNPSIF